MTDERMRKMIEAGNEIQAAVMRLHERVLDAVRDGYEMDGDLFVETMRRLEPAVNEPPHPYRTLRRLLNEAIADINSKYPRKEIQP
jgi:hypothetical protein